jgi:hypothetical protein
MRELTSEPVSTSDGQFAVADHPGGMVVAAWTDATGSRVYVAAYTATSSCRHLWHGPAEAVEACRAALAAEGLHIQRPAPEPTPTPTALTDERADVLDLFG